MGGGRFSDDDFTTLSTTRMVGKSREDTFTMTRMHPDLNPLGLKLRESRDSTDNPESTPIIIGLDVTGSMGMCADSMARTGLPTLANAIYARKPVTDPHIMCCGIGDVECDDAPLQVTQFEADIRIAEQMLLIWLEGHGGGNSHESYLLPWYLAAFHTVSDSNEKRGKKGYLFVSGDEQPQEQLSAREIERVFGYVAPQDYTFEDLYKLASEKFNVYHILVEEGDFYLHYPTRTKEAWLKHMPKDHLLHLADHTKMAELIVSTIQLNEGGDLDSIADSWGSTDTSTMLKKALKDFVVTSSSVYIPPVVSAPIVDADGNFDLTPGE